VALFRQVAPTWNYPAPHPMEPGLSSSRARDATAWPTWASGSMIPPGRLLSRQPRWTRREEESPGPAVAERARTDGCGAVARGPTSCRLTGMW